MSDGAATADTAIGHHGTYLQHAERIIVEGFKVTPNPLQYWGDGVYFYESGEADAIEWAQKRRSREHQTHELIAVIEALIELGECLDLRQQTHRDLVLDMREQLIRHGVQADTITDAVAINALADILGTDTVRVDREWASGKKAKLFPGSRLFQHVYRTLCVRNLQKILHTVISYREDES